LQLRSDILSLQEYNLVLQRSWLSGQGLNAKQPNYAGIMGMLSRQNSCRSYAERLPTMTITMKEFTKNRCVYGNVSQDS
jgi:hypothetical protein